ncbi:MAG: potassium/proton antiporter [Candidatus Binatia bacterium]|nr:potassium/proton antiporter [Candidatus Binatia bacterium]
MEPLETSLFLTAGGLLLVTAALTSPLSHRLGIPSLLFFLVVGMMAGSEGLGGIPFESYDDAYRIGTIALVLILFDGALNTPVAALRRSLAPAGLLATVGVVLTAGITAGIGILVGLPVPIAVLTGCVVSSTDAAAVFSVLRGGGIHLRGQLGPIIEVESGLNDPMAVLLTMVGTEIILGTTTLGGETGFFLAQQLVIGAAGGVAIGYGGQFLLAGIRLPSPGLYLAFTVAFAFLAYGLPSSVGGSGFLSVYIAGILLGDGPLPYRPGVRRVHEALAWLAQITMFLLLGLLVFPSRLAAVWEDGLAVGFALALVARPAAVLITLLPIRLPFPHKLFISWVGLRGAVPIILATYPLLRGVPDAYLIFDVVFFAVLVNNFIPGSTVAWLAKKADLADPRPTAPPASVELFSHGEYPGEFVWYNLDARSAVSGAYVRDLPLPDNTVVTLILRGPDVVPPRRDSSLSPGDYVCLFTQTDDQSFLNLLFGRPTNESL